MQNQRRRTKRSQQANLNNSTISENAALVNNPNGNLLNEGLSNDQVNALQGTVPQNTPEQVPPQQQPQVPQQQQQQQQKTVPNKPKPKGKGGQHVNRKQKIRFGAGSMQDPDFRYKDNTVRTTKYTPITWAPKSLLLQFKRSANVYFLIITVLTCLPLSPKQPASQIMTFTMVLVFTMLKEAYEDIQRNKSDREANNKPCLAYDHTQNAFAPKKTRELQVGDLVKVQKDEPFPADVFLLSTSNESGIAFVDTMNLDGETNLKEKICPKQTMEWREQKLATLKGDISCDGPNEFLDVWEGVMNADGQTIPGNIKALGLRGTTLRNTDDVLGYVVYTGHTTKIMKNAKNPPSKMSGVLKVMNKILWSVFILQGFIIVTFASASANWQNKNAGNHGYLGLSSDINFGTFIVRVFTFLVAYSHLIPISLYVALELLKLIEAKLIKMDDTMYYEPLDKRANVRTSELVEELGQIEFIFSDKTGTLTQNEMEFKKCSVNYEIFGNVPDQGKESKSQFTVNGESKAYDIVTGHGDSKSQQSLNEFFTMLAVCHTVMPEIDKNTGERKYQASSPDELALVEGAVQMGYVFLERTSGNIRIQLPNGEQQIWEIICEFPFDSTRKRMSVIVRKQGDNHYMVMTKGADSIMIPRLNTDKGGIQMIQKHLDQFAVDGLRTLLLGQKDLNNSDVESFIKEYEQVKASTVSNKEELLNEMYDRFEQDLDFVGCTAIEDKLQDGVPEAIATLLDADIRVWVLTGDKQETAIEIGKSCKLIMQGMDQIILSSKNQEEFQSKLEKNVSHYMVNLTDPIPPLEELSKQLVHKICIIIDGYTLNFALAAADKETRNKFFRLALLANSIICCRVSPKQKADVVAMAKDFGPWKTLSIGDGANDVSMIMEAHIGIGIYGKEGSQAVRSADFALGQFRYLKTLLLYHGRLNYRRVSNFILYYFYKNVIVVFTEIYFAFYNGFSGQIYFAEWLPMLYNAFWTSWPCLFSYMLDKDVDQETSYKFPKLFKAGPKYYYFNMQTFWSWMGFAAWHGIICFFLPVFGLTGVNDKSGEVRGHWWVSTISFCLIMHIITIKLFIQTQFWNKINWSISMISIVFYYICIILMSVSGLAKLIQPQLNGMFFSIVGSTRAWLVLLFIPWVAVGPDVIILVFKKIIYPNPSDKVLRLMKDSSNTKKRVKKLKNLTTSRTTGIPAGAQTGNRMNQPTKPQQAQQQMANIVPQ